MRPNEKTKDLKFMLFTYAPIKTNEVSKQLQQAFKTSKYGENSTGAKHWVLVKINEGDEKPEKTD